MRQEMYDELRKTANTLRRDVMEIARHAAGPSHPGPALSCCDIVTALYFHIMRVDPKRPQWEDRDRLILSKGHACPVVYAALARKGYFPLQDLTTVRRIGSYLQGHPDMKKTPGIDMTSGSLGNGLGAGAGMALYAKRMKKDFHTFVILGDGECQEGVVWEAAMCAAAMRLDKLIAIVDYNHLQSCGAVEDILPMEFMEDKWKAFGWNVLSVNGHHMEELLCTMETAIHYRGRPTVVIAHTVKGKGVSFMEHDNSWHQKIPTEAQYLQAIRELEEEMACL